MKEEFFTAVDIKEARRQVEAAWERTPRRTERVPLLKSLGRRLAVPLTAGEALPPFARSAVDGIAVRAKDTFGASESFPIYLEVTGEVAAGEAAPPLPGEGTALRIATGGMLPAGADAVVMIEYTELLDDRFIGVLKPAGPGENVLRAGEDAAPGDLLFEAGHRLKPADIGMLAALGVAEVEVFCPWRVGIVSTGDEIVGIEETLLPGKVRDVNTYLLSALVKKAGGDPASYGIVRDDFAALQEVLRLALSEQDMVLISGGSSVGARDLTAAVINSLGKPGILFHGIAMKPGKPTLGAVIAGKPVIGLPGHPASAALAFKVLVEPWLREGEEDIFLPARVKRSLASAPGREDFVWVRLEWQEGEWWAEPLLGKSGLLFPLVKGNGWLRIPPEKQGIAAGEAVKVYLE